MQSHLSAYWEQLTTAATPEALSEQGLFDTGQNTVRDHACKSEPSANQSVPGPVPFGSVGVALVAEDWNGHLTGAAAVAAAK